MVLQPAHYSLKSIDEDREGRPSLTRLESEPLLYSNSIRTDQGISLPYLLEVTIAAALSLFTDPHEECGPCLDSSAQEGAERRFSQSVWQRAFSITTMPYIVDIR